MDEESQLIMQLKEDNYRLNMENLYLKRRVASLNRKKLEHKRIIQKQNKRIRELQPDKEKYINVNKGIKRRGKR